MKKSKSSVLSLRGRRLIRNILGSRSFVFSVFIMMSEKFVCFSVIIACYFLFSKGAKAQECGNVKYTSGLIYGGEYIQRGQYPWLCAIHDTVSDEFFCGSTLISKKHVLTGEFFLGKRC